MYVILTGQNSHVTPSKTVYPWTYIGSGVTTISSK